MSALNSKFSEKFKHFGKMKVFFHELEFLTASMSKTPTAYVATEETTLR